MSEIIPLFSTPIYRSKIIDFDYGEISSQLENNSYIETYSNLYITSEEYIIDKLPKLKQNITNHLNTYLFEKLSYNPFEYYFSDSWFVKIKPGGKSFKHQHSNSLYSGVVYFDVPDDGGMIVFSSIERVNALNTIKLKLIEKEKTIYNSNTWAIKPMRGDILIFPSYIQHEVNLNESKEDRYSFAFNIFPVNYQCNILGARITQR
jgi:uncharacterized protein (TIGR02466 family)